MEQTEGSTPDYDMASDQETIGVLDQGMFSKGWLGNLGDPDVSYAKLRFCGTAVRKTNSGSAASVSPTGKEETEAHRYQGRIVNSEQTWDGLLEVLADHSTNSWKSE